MFRTIVKRIEGACRDAALDVDMLGDPRREIGEDVSIPRYQLPMAILDMRQSPNTVDVQFVDEFIGVEGSGTAGKPHGT